MTNINQSSHFNLITTVLNNNFYSLPKKVIQTPSDFKTVDDYIFIWGNNFLYEFFFMIQNNFLEKRQSFQMEIVEDANYFNENLIENEIKLNEKDEKLFVNNNLLLLSRRNGLLNNIYSIDKEILDSNDLRLAIIQSESKQGRILYLSNSDSLYINKLECKDVTNETKKNRHFKKGEVIFFRIVSNLTTSFREYNSLLRLNFKFPFLNHQNISESVISYFDNRTNMNCFIENNHSLYKEYNQSQSNVISNIYSWEINKSKSNLCLVKGPPGTGKTHTIIGIIRMLRKKHKSKCKILICAPSNNAIDELTVRLYKHFEEDKGKDNEECLSKRELVRFYANNEKSVYDEQYPSSYILYKNYINIDSSKVFNNEAFEKKSKSKIESKYIINHRRIDNKQKKPENSQPKLTNPSHNILSLLYSTNITSSIINDQQTSFDIQINQLRQEIKLQPKHMATTIEKKIEEIKRNKERHFYRINKGNIEEKVLSEAKIVTTTLNSSGHSKLKSIKFDYLIIDEASQAIEPSCLIPIEKANNIILFGDEMQLPPTVFNDKNIYSKYNRSLFERCIDIINSDIVLLNYGLYMLDIQYRMESKILKFVSETFYNGKVKCGLMKKSERKFSSKKSIFEKILHFEFAFLYYSYKESTQVKEGQSLFSYSNKKECYYTIEFLFKFITNIKKENLRLNFEGKIKISIGVISFYKEQVCLLRQHFNILFSNHENNKDNNNCFEGSFRRSDEDILFDIEINTVDSFQGKEKDVIIISCVRSNETGSIGFLNEYKRLNVSISRAKYICIIIGDLDTIEKSENYYWNKLIEFHKKESTLIGINDKIENIFIE